jgi:hypothetical protein
VRRALLLALAAALVLPAAAQAAKPPPQVDAAKQGLAKAVAAGRLEPVDAARYRGILARAAHALPRLGGSRNANLKAVLGDVAAQASRYTPPRALTLFAMLDENVRWFGAQGPPAPQADEVGPDKVVYRYFPGHGLQFHPLANFAALNSHLASGRLDSARALAEALRARGIASGPGIVWEYEFHYGGGSPPWTSGMAQAVAAQALARAGARLEDDSLGALARRASLAIPGKLDLQLPAGRWIRLYSFSRMAVFNAQLQAAVSLRDYADLAADTEAGALADALRAAAQKALPQVDTGYWTRYSVGGSEESRGYHDFVVSILGRLKTQTKDSFWSDLAARFKGYTTQPPLFQLGPPPAPVLGRAKADASFGVSFWLSKLSSVTVQAGSQRRSLWLGYGWHRLTWKLPGRRAGVFPATIQASPIAGPRASASLSPLVVLARAPAGLGQLAVTPGAAGPGVAGAGLLVGATENAVLSADPAASAGQLALATAAGLRAVRIAVPWTSGQAAPDAGLLQQLQTTAGQAAAAGVRLFLEVYPASPAVAPADDARRAEYASFVGQIAAAVPQIRDFVIGSQVNSAVFWPQSSAAAGSYLALLAAAYDALKGVDSATRVIGGALNSQAAPGTFVLALGQAYRRSGRAAPVMDALAIQPSPASSTEPATAVHPTGPTTIADYPRLVANLKRAFNGTAQPGATLPIVYDGYGVQSLAPPAKASLYANAETDAIPEAAHGAAYVQALQLAACQPTVSALLFEHVVDERDLAGRQTGLYYPDATPKSDFSAVQAAVAAAGSGTLVQCPGATPAPSEPPSVSVSSDGRSATISCPGGCNYLAVLARGGAGLPLRASESTLAGGAGVTVSVPAAGLLPGDRLVVRAAARRNPGSELVREGVPPLG